MTVDISSFEGAWFLMMSAWKVKWWRVKWGSNPRETNPTSARWRLISMKLSRLSGMLDRIFEVQEQGRKISGSNYLRFFQWVTHLKVTDLTFKFPFPKLNLSSIAKPIQAPDLLKEVQVCVWKCHGLSSLFPAGSYVLGAFKPMPCR